MPSLLTIGQDSSSDDDSDFDDSLPQLQPRTYNQEHDLDSDDDSDDSDDNSDCNGDGNDPWIFVPNDDTQFANTAHVQAPLGETAMHTLVTQLEDQAPDDDDNHVSMISDCWLIVSGTSGTSSHMPDAFQI
jgi:hypothetical protein